jgi:peptidoglycan/LPS O-acetylase OafA/YrhL
MPDAHYRADIDGLRGIAVAAVVIFHAFPAALPGGFVGVDVFFVISGFLISSLVLTAVEEGRFSFAAFYARRIRRLFPALVLVLSAALVAGWYLLTPRAFERLGADTATAAAFFANVSFWRQSDYFAPAAETTPLLHLWSLGVEEQFYLTWPVLLAVAARRRLHLTAITLVLLAASFVANVVIVRDDAAAAFYLPHTRAWELLAGALLAIRAYGARPVGASWWSVAGLCLIAATCAALSGDARFPGWWAAVPVAGACLVIAAGPESRVNRWLSHPVIVWLGLVSYPLYLWHWPILSFARLAMVDRPQAPLLLGLIGLAVLLAWLTQSLIERPVRFGVLRYSWTAVAGLIVCVVAAGAAGAAAAEGVLPGRPTSLDRVLANVYDYRAGYRGQVCQLANGQDPDSFAGECVDREFAEPGRLGVLIWGDSHAAHLYPGLRARADGAGLALAQYTADGCAPLVGGNCRLTEWVLGRLPVLEPDVIVLAAEWDERRVDLVPATVAAIRKVSGAGIVVVGPVPGWSADLPHVLRVATTESDGAIPVRLRTDADDSRGDVDAQVRNAARGDRVRFASAIDALCNADGCLTVINDRVTAFDSAHLTDVGSAVVADAIVAELRHLR